MFYSIISSFKGKVILLTDVFLDSKWFIIFGILIVYAVIYVLIIRVFVHYKLYHGNLWPYILERCKLVSQKTKSPKEKTIKKKNYFSEIFFLKNLFLAFEFLSWKISWNIFLLITIFTSILFFILLISIFSKFLSFIIILFLNSILCIFIFYHSNQQKIKLVEQIPSFLLALSNALGAGYSLEQAFFFIENEVENPLKKEIYRITKSLRLNIHLEKVLHNFANRMQHRDIFFFTEATVLQRKTGGNLMFLFKKISEIIENRLKIQRDLKTFTSQGKYSGIIICSLWFFSLLLFWFIAPKHIEILFSTKQGQTMLGVSLFLELLGFFYIWRIVHIKI